MMTQQDHRQLQTERANLIAHLSAARRILSYAGALLTVDRMLNKAMPSAIPFTPAQQEALDRIDAYLKVDMFAELPEEIAR